MILKRKKIPIYKNYNIIYGFGYVKFLHESDEITQELEVFVAKDDSVKINILTLKNNAPKKKKIKLKNQIRIGKATIK